MSTGLCVYKIVTVEFSTSFMKNHGNKKFVSEILYKKKFCVKLTNFYRKQKKNVGKPITFVGRQCEKREKRECPQKKRFRVLCRSTHRRRNALFQKEWALVLAICHPPPKIPGSVHNARRK